MNEHFETIKGIKTHFQKIGTGPLKLLFLHGWGGSLESFEKLATSLHEKNDWTLYLLDLPGFGKSEMPSLEGWNIAEYTEWLSEFIKQENIQNPSFYGHSFGCRVIVDYLLKTKNSIRKVVLTGAAGIKWPLSFKQKTAQILSKKFSWIKHCFPEKFQKLILNKIFGAKDWSSVSPALKNTLQKTLEESDIRDRLQEIKVPVLLLWGKHDSYTPLKSAYIFEKELPNAKLIVFEDGRHGIHYTHTDKIALLVTNFLKEK